MLKLSLSLSLCCPFVIVDLLLHVLNDIIRLGPAYMKLKVQWSWFKKVYYPFLPTTITRTPTCGSR